MSDRRYEELAQRLCAAVLSHHMGVTYQTAVKYLRDDDRILGAYWHDLAARVAREMAHLHAHEWLDASKAAHVKTVATHLSLVPKPQRE